MSERGVYTQARLLLRAKWVDEEPSKCLDVLLSKLLLALTLRSLKSSSALRWTPQSSPASVAVQGGQVSGPNPPSLWQSRVLPGVSLAPKAERALKHPPPASSTTASCQSAEPVRPGALHPTLPAAGQEDGPPEAGRPLCAGAVPLHQPGPRRPQHPPAHWLSGRQVGTPRARRAPAQAHPPLCQKAGA